MSEFINTSDVIGDDELCDQIIGRTITEIKENRVTSIGSFVFYGCSALTTADFPAVTTISTYAFEMCPALTTADFPAVTSIGSFAFSGCSALTTLILRNTNKVCTLGTSTFNNTAIASGTGYIYVPAALVDSYKAATNWATYANQIRAIEDYPDICGAAE